MPISIQDLDIIHREIFEAARNGSAKCSMLALRLARAALESSPPDPALEYIRNCLGRLLEGTEARDAFNLPKRKRGGQPSRVNVDSVAGNSPSEHAVDAMILARDALDTSPRDPALEYLRDCLERLIVGKEVREAFNLPKRRRGRPSDLMKVERDARIRADFRLLRKGTKWAELDDEDVVAIASWFVLDECVVCHGVPRDKVIDALAKRYNLSLDAVCSILSRRR